MTRAEQITTVYRVLRTEINLAGYGAWIKDPILVALAEKIVNALEQRDAK